MASTASPGGQGGLESARERILETLTTAFSTDLISMEEYERRASLAQQAPSEAEMARLVADLPQAARFSQLAEASPGRGAAPAAPVEAARAPLRVDGSLSGAQTVACVMGERHLQGDFLNGSRIESFTLMGSTRIDLRDAVLPPDRLKIEAFACMGELRVIVPRGLPVRMSVFPFMGEATARRDVSQRVVAGEPHVHIEGFVFMGSLVVEAKDR